MFERVTMKKQTWNGSAFFIGGGERAWTADQRIMSPLLLPTELHPLKFSFGVMNRIWTDIQRNHNPRLYR